MSRERIYRIKSVEVVRYPVLRITFDDGLSGEYDLTDLIADGPAFAPLKDEAHFKTVAVGAYGHTFGWNLDDVGNEIDFCPDSTRIQIEIQKRVAQSLPTERPLTMPRRDTSLEAEGAEFLILAHLLIEKIPAYKTYTRMAAYDIVATNPETNKSARIQVKSRWRRNAPAFPLKRLDCDFVVFVALNRSITTGAANGAVEYHVFPIEVLKAVHRSTLAWGGGGIRLSDIPNRQEYKANWRPLIEFLEARATQ